MITALVFSITYVSLLALMIWWAAAFPRDMT